MSSPRLRWRSSPYDAIVEQVCLGWQGTEYVLGQCKKGVGADCVRFGAAVLSELERRPMPKLPIVSPDAARFRPQAWNRAAKALLRAFPGFRRFDPCSEPVEAGDILLTGPSNTAPGHMQVVGGEKNRIWHAAGHRVSFTGLVLRADFTTPWAYRSTNRERWRAS